MCNENYDSNFICTTKKNWPFVFRSTAMPFIWLDLTIWSYLTFSMSEASFPKLPGGYIWQQMNKNSCIA